jgi:hypothetical protein
MVIQKTSCHLECPPPHQQDLTHLVPVQSQKRSQACFSQVRVCGEKAPVEDRSVLVD